MLWPKAGMKIKTFLAISSGLSDLQVIPECEVLAARILRSIMQHRRIVPRQQILEAIATVHELDLILPQIVRVPILRASAQCISELLLFEHQVFDQRILVDQP